MADLRAEQSGEPLRPRTDLMQVSVDLPLEAYIPEDYIADLPSRLGRVRPDWPAPPTRRRR